MQAYTFSVSGISCGSCVSKIENALSAEEKFKSIQILRQPDRVEIESQTPLHATDINSIFQRLNLKKYSVLDMKNVQPLSSSAHTSSQTNLFKQLFPLALVISYLLATVVTVAWATDDFSINSLMFHYMAGFFIVFSFFKFLNLEGFADAFQTYDPIAKKWKPYGYLYAGFELVAGMSYLINPTSTILNILVLTVLTISSVGVIKAVRNKTRIQCACLGTVFKLPMTKVTVVENVSMISMAFIVIFRSLI